MKGVIAVLMLFAIAGLIYYNKNAAIANANAAAEAATHEPFVPAEARPRRAKPLTVSPADHAVEYPTSPQTAPASSFSCDGRQHCSQMRSCSEAEYFIQHCPNTKMDGDRDGIPCEEQWC